ncbi:DNA cytosine methyltransferase [Streptomyces sp. NBC_01707]|uniref:DNA cytosine methyltransferase n=1 Tax=Streptomyces sp. NBC_01707 TaxID=2975914 RepID=UPI00352EF698
MTQPVPIRRVPDQALRAVALCAGYGGLEAALGAGIGAVPVAYAENDPYAAKVFAAHHPGIPNLGDITRIDWDQVRALHRPDVIGAGFPCRNISNAGRKDGINGQWSKVWKNVAQAVGVLRPRYVFLENVAALRSRGLDVVAADLAAIGYGVRWTCLRAGDPEVGAPHQRDRWFAVAHPADADPHDLRRHWRPRHVSEAQGRDEPANAGDEAAGDTGREGVLSLLPSPTVADSRGTRNYTAKRRPGAKFNSGKTLTDFAWLLSDERWISVDGVDYSPAIRRWEGILNRRAPEPTDVGRTGNRRITPAFAEWLMGLPTGWVTAVPDIPRKEQLRILGNGVVPQQAHHAYGQLLGAVPAPWNTTAPLEVAA